MSATQQEVQGVTRHQGHVYVRKGLVAVCVISVPLVISNFRPMDVSHVIVGWEVLTRVAMILESASVE